MKPPSSFTPCGEIAWGALCDRAPGFAGGKRTGRKLSGIKYEARVHEHFQAIYGQHYQPAVWIMFREQGAAKVRYAQVDALLFDINAGTITIVEIKYNHIEKAWWQLHHLYTPLIQHIFGKSWTIKCIEVVKWYDPATFFPGPLHLCKTLDQAPTRDTGLHIWRPTNGRK